MKNLENIFLGFAEYFLINLLSLIIEIISCEDLANQGFEAIGFALREYLPNLKNCVLDFTKYFFHFFKESKFVLLVVRK